MDGAIDRIIANIRSKRVLSDTLKAEFCFQPPVLSIVFNPYKLVKLEYVRLTSRKKIVIKPA